MVAKNIPTGTLPNSVWDFMAQKAAASGLASLDSGSRVVQSPKLHASDHTWGGADPIIVSNLSIGAVPFYIFECDTGMTKTQSGTGVATQAKPYMSLTTGATSGGYCGLVFDAAWWHQYASASYRYRWGAKLIANLATTDKWEAWFGMFADTSTFPTTTSNHYGFRLLSESDGVNAVLQASSGNGSSGTQTQIVASVAGYATKYILAIYNGTAIYFYSSSDAVTWTLGATHTHGVEYTPNSLSLYFGAWSKNSENTDKQLGVFCPRVKIGE